MRVIISEGCRQCFLLLFVLGLLISYTSAAPNFATKVSSGDQVLVVTTDATEINDDEPSGGTTVASQDETAESWEIESENNDVHEKARMPGKYTIRPKTQEPYKTVKPEIYSFRIQSDITYRYSKTYVTSRVANRDLKKAQEVTFRVVLPETAFISKFLMEIDGKSYEAYVKEKEEAKRVYNQAQSQGQTAGLVELSTRNSNIFNVNVNIKPQAKVTFNLTYEELLNRRLGRYEQTINISPEQITSVKDFEIVVNIEESQNLTHLKVPNLRNDVESQESNDDNNQDAIIVRPAGNRANITWRPSVKDQEGLSKQGLAGKFVVQYDVNRESNSGEILVMEGYFVHFFAPEKLQPLRKHVVFILDISGSMWGRKMEQLKDSQKKILDDLSTDDFFNIITFSSDVFLWAPTDPIALPTNNNPYQYHGETTPRSIQDSDLKNQPFPATKENIAKAKAFIDSLQANGGTNIHDSIITALNLTSLIKDARDGIVRKTTEDDKTITYEPLPTALPMEDATTLLPEVEISSTTSSPSTEAPVSANGKTVLPKNVESLIIFLTDGEPTVGITDPPYIQQLIQAANRNLTIPIFSLGFGEGADFPFLRKLSLQNYGFGRKIYEASDAALQLKGFYNEIASPLLSNVTFNYTSPEYNVTDVTITRFPTVFGGTEIAIAGKLIPVDPNDQDVEFAQEQSVANSDTVAETEAPAIFEDSVLPQEHFEKRLVPADKQYLDVSIVGSGREGIIDFDMPPVFCRPIPWGIPSPFPPRPTPPPSREDEFLERLWAYLTIQQLIEKDLKEGDAFTNTNEIEDSENSPVSSTTTPTASKDTVDTGFGLQNSTSQNIKETPKQQALRLALKYGFVTPFTSLVVVKPNSSDVTDAVSSDAKPEYADSLAAPQSMAQFAYLKPQHSTQHKLMVSNRIGGPRPQTLAYQGVLLPLSLHASQPASGFLMPGMPGIPYYSKQPYPALSTTIRPSLPHYNIKYHSTTPSLTLNPAFAPEALSADYDSGPLEEQSLTSLEPSFATEESTTVKSLTIDDITWFNSRNLVMRINETDYKISLNQTDVDQGSAYANCTIKPNGEKGQCTHLKDCVLSDFTQRMDVFTDSYFCPIQSLSTNGVHFVGACCPSRGKSLMEDP